MMGPPSSIHLKKGSIMAPKLPFYIRDIVTEQIVQDSEITDIPTMLDAPRTRISSVLERRYTWLFRNRYMIHRDKDILAHTPILIAPDSCEYNVTLLKISTFDNTVVFQTETPVTLSQLHIDTQFGISRMLVEQAAMLARVTPTIPISVMARGFKIVIQVYTPPSIRPITIDMLHGANMIYQYSLFDGTLSEPISHAELFHILATRRGMGPMIFPAEIGTIYREITNLKKGKIGKIGSTGVLKTPRIKTST